MSITNPRGPNFLRSIAELVRLRSCVAGAIACVAGAHIAGIHRGATAEVALAAISAACAIAFAETTNDIIDIDLDLYDKPSRPLPSGRLSVGSAWFLAGLSAVAGLIFAFLAQEELVIFMLVVLALSWAYSRYWKSTVLTGNVVVALLASSTILYGATSVGGTVTFRAALVQTFAFAVALTLEVVKTARDVAGDAAAGTTTLATRHGIRHSAILAAGLCILVVPLALAPTPQIAHPIGYLIVIGIGVASPALAAASRLAAAREASDLTTPHRLVRMMWGFMVISLFFA